MNPSKTKTKTILTRDFTEVVVLKPPLKLENGYSAPTLFLGGSIEMGKAKDWHSEVTETILESGWEGKAVILNPRRDEWDASWQQDPSVHTPFNNQVLWELEAQSISDILIYNFEPETMSPITLLELGLHIGKASKRKFVVCPEAYQRYGNVKISCEMMGKNFKFYHKRDEKFYQDLLLSIQYFDRPLLQSE